MRLQSTHANVFVILRPTPTAGDITIDTSNIVRLFSSKKAKKTGKKGGRPGTAVAQPPPGANASRGKRGKQAQVTLLDRKRATNAGKAAPPPRVRYSHAANANDVTVCIA